MLTRLIELSIENRFLVLVIAVLLAVAGIDSALRLPIDAVPDMTNVQVTVITSAESLSPIEVERYVTYPVEATMGGLPKVEEVRSISRFGISVVTIVFREGTDIYWARNLVNERLTAAAARIPAGYGVPELGPLATALGEILQFEVRSDEKSLTELRSILDWEIAPQLRSVRGVTEVNTHGGHSKTYDVRPNPERLTSYGVSLEELFNVLQTNNQTAGGGYVVHDDEQRFIRGQALLTSSEDIGEVVIRRERDGNPILVRDVAEIVVASMARQGAVTRDGRGEGVVGMAMMLVGENSFKVVQGVKSRLKELQQTLPPDVSLEIIYDRSALIGRTLHTVVKNLLEGGLLVIIVLLLMLGSARAGLITATAIPLSMLSATTLMRGLGVTASLMSLGAIDFGLIVDSSVIMVENCMHRLAHAPQDKTRAEIIRDAAVEVRKPTLFGELIIAVVYFPILLLQGTEGKLFRPMALTVLFAMFGSLVISLTLMPVLATIALPRNLKDKENWLTRWLKRLYRPVVSIAIAHPGITATMAIGVLAASVPVATRLGAEFMPRLEEGDLLIEMNRLPSATLENGITICGRIEEELLRFPEVKTVYSKTGRPEIANDVMGVQQSDIWVMLKDKHDWPEKKSLDQLKKEMSKTLNSRVPGASFAFTQPIEMRVDELVAGVKADVAALLYGPDLQVLGEKAKEIERVLSSLPGATDVKADYQANLTALTIIPDRAALARYGIPSQNVMDVVAALGGHEVGVIFDGRARYPIRVRVPEEWRADAEWLRQLPVSQAGDRLVPLGELAEIRVEETPPSIEHDANRRRTFVAANVQGRDVASFVVEAQRAVATKVNLPSGYEIRWGGDFENLQSASRRLLLITPIVLLLIFLLLHTSFRSPWLALLIFLAVPIAASGGVFALALRGMPFSISAGVGFIALFGVAVLNGLVWVNSAEQMLARGVSMSETTRETAVARLRPILMTALVASFGFVPMAISTSDGAEIQRPLATVVIGGLLTSTLLTSLVVPAIYPWFASRTPTRAATDGSQGSADSRLGTH